MVSKQNNIFQHQLTQYTNTNTNNTSNELGKIIGKISGILFINEFGNGFVNTNTSQNPNPLLLLNESPNDKPYQNQITIHIPKNKLSGAYHLEYVDVEYFINPDKPDIYEGKIINYSLINKVFAGIVHHYYKNDVFIYIPELKINNLVKIKTSFYLLKQSWISLKIIEESPELLGQLLEYLPHSLNTILAIKYNLFNLPENIYVPDTNYIPQMIKDEKDQRHLYTITIDPPNSQDCDDAISIEYVDINIAKIYIHISNVAYYFNPGNNNSIWELICQRGFTTYGINGINWPMLPPNYANNICSILPNKDTHTITYEFIFNTETKKLSYYGLYCSIVRSKYKYDYDTFDTLITNYMNNKLDTNMKKNNTYTDIEYSKMIDILYESAKVIKSQYTDFIFNDESPAHWIIRYWMITTNTIMSKGIYRYNAEPKNDKKNLLNRYIHHKYANKYNSLLGLDSDSDLDSDIISRKNKIKIINENNDDKLVIYLGKIALNKSKYSANREENIHYGIGIMGYSHWTSPIRRLPDLLNQCLLLGYDISKETIDKYLEHVNYIELKQDDIEHFCNCWNNNSSYDIGDILTGIIIKTSQTGIITYIESLNRRYSIHISKLSKNRLEWNAETMELKSSNFYNDSYKLFDNIELIIIKKCFDIIEFDLVKK